MTNNKTQSANRKTCIILKLLGLMILIFVIMILQFSKSISFFVESSLGGHMIVEHSIFFLMGYSIATISNKQSIRDIYFQVKSHIFLQKHSSYSKKDIIKKDYIQNNNKYLWFLIGIFLMTFWHIPIVFDIASYDDLVHLFQHISFVFVGVCIYKIIKNFDFSFLLFFFILSGGFMGIMGLVLTLTKHSIYSFYTIQSHMDAGTYMIISGIIMMLVILPFVLIKKAIESI